MDQVHTSARNRNFGSVLHHKITVTGEDGKLKTQFPEFESERERRGIKLTTRNKGKNAVYCVTLVFLVSERIFMT